MKLDLIIVEAESWGWQLCLRTGSPGFNREVLLKAMHQEGYASDEGCLYRDGQAIATREEGDVFRLVQLPWYEPWAREVQL
jgi:DNA polymerase/3'-5' exonuclease PolX